MPNKGLANQTIHLGTGKQGQGILPVIAQVGETVPTQSRDRLFVYTRLAGDTTCDAFRDQLPAAWTI